jgi:hypothetical protein
MAPRAAVAVNAIAGGNCQKNGAEPCRTAHSRKPSLLAGFCTSSDVVGLVNGGGGGNRTPVRKHSAKASTCLVRDFNLVSRTAHTQAADRPATYCFGPVRGGGGPDPYPTEWRSVPGRGRTRAERHSTLGCEGELFVRSYVFAHRIIEPVERSACNFRFLSPVEPKSPPERVPRSARNSDRARSEANRVGRT